MKILLDREMQEIIGGAAPEIINYNPPTNILVDHGMSAGELKVIGSADFGSFRVVGPG